MMPRFLPTALLLTSLSSAEVVWEENFDTVAPSIYPTNTNVGNVQFSNTLTGEVTSVVPAGFTSASGNVALLSTGTSKFSAIRPSSNPIILPPLADGGSWTLSFDMFIPADLVQAVGGMANYRWKDGGANNVNGPSDYSSETLTAGEHHMVYTGTFPIDIGNGPFLPLNARPFINFDQVETVVQNYVYVDNIHFEVDVSSEDPNLNSRPQNFGTFVQSEGPYSRPMTIENSGINNVLTISGAGISGANADEFSVTNTTFPLNINPGESATIQVTFDPADEIGEFVASLDIASNDQGNSSLSFILSGGVEAPFEGRELVVNGDFETGDISGWRDDGTFTHSTDPVFRGAGAAFYTTLANNQWGNARLATTPPLGPEGLPDHLVITPEMYGKEFAYSAWVYHPSESGLEEGDTLSFIMRWNGVQAGATVLALTEVSEIPFDTWVRLSGRGTVPETDDDGIPTASVRLTWSFRDFGEDNPGGLMTYIDEVSLKIDAPIITEPVPLEITDIIVNPDDDLIQITWNANVGTFYKIERSTDLENWIELDDSLEALEETYTYTDLDAAGLTGPRYFYRVTEE